MKYERFEDLPVWALAASLAADIFRFSREPAFRGQGDLANQIQRATLSISRQIRAWAKCLKNSEITGQHHLNDRTRSQYEEKKIRNVALEEHRAFMARLETRLKSEAEHRRNESDKKPES